MIDLGIVRRRKLDVAADIPARRIADIPVELDGRPGRSIRAAERALTAGWWSGTSGAREPVSRRRASSIDHDLVRHVAR